MKLPNKLLTLLCCAALCVSAYGAESWLRVTLTDGEDAPCGGVELRLYAVCGPEGTLAEAFQDCGLSADALLDQQQNAKNAKALLAWAEEADLAGDAKTTDEEGRAAWGGLARGVYLVCCPEGQKEVMLPFLVYMEGTDVNAAPKVEPPEDPDRPHRPDDPDVPDEPDIPGGPDVPVGPEDPGTPEGPEDPSGPEIPQTGVNVWPMYLLAGAGILLVLAGAVELRRGRHE